MVAGLGFDGGAAAAGDNGLFGRVRWNQTAAAIADEVSPTGLDEGFSHGEVVFRFEKLHQ